MSDTNFVAGTTITSDWLNDLNDFFYTQMAGSTGGVPNQLQYGGATFDFLGADASRQVRITTVEDAVNYWNFEGATTGNFVYMRPSGADTNIGVSISSKGTGAINFYTNHENTLQASITHVASAVNYLDLKGAVTTGSPRLSSLGTDTNIGIELVTKGTGQLFFYTQSTSAVQAAILHTPNAANFVGLTGGAAGADPSVGAYGSDSNIDLILKGKGTGVVSFGTRSALAAETVTGYITIKDAGGTERKLAVVS